MIVWIGKLLGTKRQRDIRQMRPLVARVNELERQYQRLTNEQLRAKTDEFRERLKKGEELDSLMCEAFAAVKNACRRLVGSRFDVCGHELQWNEVPWDSQIMAGIVLHQHKIAELATGEGKTLAATMPLYLNCLAGENVHLVTTNDFLARRDSQWMGQVYGFLGVTVGCIQNHMDSAERREQYGRDITYGTNSEFGFDYLRDNGMARDPAQLVQRGHHFAIVDEVDSILIDEARTPLIISGPAPTSSHQYTELKPRVEALVARQRDLCNRFVREAREKIEAGATEAAQLLLYQVRHGMPKHKQLMHMLEEPATRRLLEQIENSMLTDMRKEQARELREELFFTIDERGHDAGLTEKGCTALNPSDPDAFMLPDLMGAMSDLDGDASLAETERAARRAAILSSFSEKNERIHNVDQLIRAYALYERDVEYVVQDNQVLIVDEFTGRILPGRRWSDGLHQAVEAKEGVKIERETQTLATITIQNYFRMYRKLAGMTGTAETEAGEFSDIYKLDVVVIPTNRPVRRVDFNDLVYKTQREKYKALIEEIRERHAGGQPILVGTASVDTSEIISRMLRREGIAHTVLNAKNHEREADIVMVAGQPGAVTIATNMAGRGTDIKLGEGVVHIPREIITSQQALDARVEGGKTLRQTLVERPSGLHVIGSERHEARRIDRQLRGRCARQGDPGSSRFYVSLEDDLMRLFGSDRIAGIMSRLGMQEGEPLEHRWLDRSIETAQRRVEQQNFSIRKRTLEYDDVMNKQREVVYGFRGEVLRAEAVREQILDVARDAIASRCEGLDGKDESAPEAFRTWARTTFPIALSAEETAQAAAEPERLQELVFERVRAAYEIKVGLEDPAAVNALERTLILHAVDTHWQDYLRAMDVLRQGVGLRAYGQRDPLVEYKREAFSMFEELMLNIKQDVAASIFRSATTLESFQAFMSSLPMTLVHDEVSALAGARRAGAARPRASAAGMPDVPPPEEMMAPAGMPRGEPVHRDAPKVGRNDPCPCGSGKKHKKCCGA
jgi:preprotein translocase subunit SecA